MQRTGGQLVVDTLARHGVEVVFGIPGVHTLSLYDALIDSPIRHVTARHEQGAGFMADGYARASGRIGVVLPITGPGAANALTPVLQADSDSSPVLVVASGLSRSHRGRRTGTLHECRDQFALFAGQLDCVGLAERVEAIPGTVADIIGAMARGRPQPGYVEIPHDLLDESTEVCEAPLESTRPNRPASDTESLARAAELLATAQRPLIVAGGGAHDAHAVVQRLAEALHCPVATTPNGKGVLPEDHPLSVGVCEGRNGAFEAARAETDLLLVLASELSERTAAALGEAEAPLIHCDLDSDMIGRHLPAEAALVGDAATTARELLRRLGPCAQPTQEKRDCATRAVHGPPEIAALYDALRTALPRDTLFFCDMTVACYHAARCLPVYQPRSFFFPTGFGTLGFALPAAIGAKLAAPERPVVALCGDGGFLFTAQELATVAHEPLSLTVIVFNDNAYGAVGRSHERRFNGRSLGADLTNPSFVALARSFGLSAEQVGSPAALRQAVSTAQVRPGATVIEYPLERTPPF